LAAAPIVEHGTGKRQLACDDVTFFYNASVKTWDVIIIGAGIIGLSLAIELRKKGATVLVVERGEPGREASYAAGGMLVGCSAETPELLQPLAIASARMYPEFVHELQVESGIFVDLREQGAIVFPPPEHVYERPGLSLKNLLPAALAELEPALADHEQPAFYLQERSVDPRALASALLHAARKRGVDISSGDEVTSVNIARGRAVGVTTNKTSFAATTIVNCAGAWSGQIAPHAFPTRPVKGQMLYLVSRSRDLLKHVIRSPEVYVVPRSDGRILVGTTLEEAGFDKRTDPDTIQRLYRAAVALIPALKDVRILEDWAGLRPGTPDGLPILGETETPGYYVATGHFRDGILLAPVTAKIMACVIAGQKPEFDISAFSAARL
jgi:glycine oxidase